MLDPDKLAIFADVLQVMTYLEILTEANNNDLLQELQHQNKEYLQRAIKQNETIIAQNEEIIERLKNGQGRNIKKN